MISAENVRAAAAGDSGAVGRLLREIRPLVVRYCRARLGRRGGSFDTADAVAHEACLAVLRALPAPDKPFLTLVYGILTGKAAESRWERGPGPADVGTLLGRTSLGTRPAVACRTRGAGHGLDGRAGAVTADLLRDEGMHRQGPWPVATDTPPDRMTRMLTLLPAKAREVIVLRLVVGLSVADTAEAMGVTPASVRETQHHALARLRTAMRPDEPA